MKSGAGRNKDMFIVNIVGRENSTWQGNVIWGVKQQIQNFRSALELLKLIDGALDENVEIEGGDHEK